MRCQRPELLLQLAERSALEHANDAAASTLSLRTRLLRKSGEPTRALRRMIQSKCLDPLEQHVEVTHASQSTRQSTYCDRSNASLFLVAPLEDSQGCPEPPRRHASSMEIIG